MLEALHSQSKIEPAITLEWAPAMTLVYNKPLAGPHTLQCASLMTDVRVYDQNGTLMHNAPGQGSTSTPFSVSPPLGVTELRFMTRPATGADLTSPEIGLSVVNQGEPPGMMVTSLTGIELAQCRKLYVNEFSNLISVPKTLSPLLQHLQLMGSSKLNDPNISEWDTSNLTSMYRLLFGARAFNQPVDGWNTSKVTSLNSTFALCTSFNQTFVGWDVSKVTTVDSLLVNSSVFNQDLSRLIFKSTVSRNGYDTGTTAWNAAYRPKFTG